MKIKRLIALVAVVATAASVLAACGPDNGNTAGSGKRVEGGTITYAHAQEPPCLWGGWVQQAYLSRQVFDSLVSYDDGKIVPWLATSWEESKDRKTITFQLRKDVKFTDGTPFDAAAVAANYPSWAAGIGWHSFTYMTGAKATGKYTVQLSLSEPNPEIYNVLANGHYGLQSPTALKNNSTEKNCLQPVGTGPWVVKKWTRGEGIQFVRNDQYSSAPQNAKHQGPAYAEELDWKFVPDATTRWGALTTGEADAIYDVPSVQWATANREYDVLDFVATGRPQSLSFNVKQGPFTDKRVRQAFAYASDRRTIVDTVFKGSVPFEGNGAVSRSTPLYEDVDASYPFDVAKADQLLDDAGWTQKDKNGIRVKDGKKLTIRFPYGNGAIINSDGSAVLQAIQDQVKKVGFDVKLIPLTQTELFGGAYAQPNQKELSFGYWVWPSPNILDINFRAKQGDAANGNNTTFLDDPDFEKKVLAAQREADPTKRQAQYDALQQWLDEEAITVGVYNFTYNVATSKKLKGLWQDQGNGLLNFNDAYFVE